MATSARAPQEHLYREVRGLSRGLAVLRALNALPGGIGGVVELARVTGIHRTTVKRLLETLRSEGLVHHKDDGASYALGFEVRRLSEGYVGADWIDRVAAPAMRAHLRALSWPSDLATPDAGFMIVRESTHRVSMLSQHRATIGIRIPMLVSSLGRAWLSWCAEEERVATLALLAQRTDAIGEMARDGGYVKRIIRETRRRGYAMNRGEWASESSVTAIGFPIRIGEHAIGAINLVLQNNVVSDREVATRYVPLLRQLADGISEATSSAPRG
ncbi:IclR family mhp operon transcriptional activator [Variovorax boronicumulans]|uniref:IclR family mhp operon transcriptional activator n=1 Tax=Variovorax boronicumulans TaxID=436515 RepID=A0AAW8DT62_9BURK|nr:DNA-binding transcriptional regulator [Variovorax boronicumulans]MDP9877455.1 IclR family mhp operon transcriptional activator [Variovorax boronicumulans]MDP9922740.1 IclR family mhp operon transcriptional activator [Variovorax boronicumulans]